SPDGIFVVTFANAWPDLKPFRIELVPIGVGAISGPPSFAADTLTVELAPSQRETVRINSLIDPADIDKRGVWQWTDELAPPNLAQVRTSVIKGRHWAHLPWREITLVYATQKPELDRSHRRSRDRSAGGITGCANFPDSEVARV